MTFSLFPLRNSIPWILVLISFFTFSRFSGYGFSSILITSLVLILSSVFFTFSKQKSVLVEKTKEIEPLCSEKTQENVVGQIQDYLLRSPDLYSERGSISLSSTSEDSDGDWPYSGNVGPTPDGSDGSISDEESLIEIALPSGHYVSPKEEAPKLNLQDKFQNLSADNIFGESGFMELLAEINEVNEEENLIEIDISMGSIKS